MPELLAKSLSISIVVLILHLIPLLIHQKYIMNCIKSVVLAALSLLILANCQQAPAPSATKQLAAAAPTPFTGSGYLYQSEGKTTFAPCDGSPSLQVADATGLVAAALAQRPDPMGECPGEPTWAKLSGSILEGALTLAKVDSTMVLNKFSACSGFEFACGGNEPFWQVIILPKDQVAYYKQLGMEQGVTFSYAAPAVVNGKTVYSLANKANASEKMTITIEKKVCGDGMSDMKYPYESTVKFKGETLIGTAEKVGEMAKE